MSKEEKIREIKKLHSEKFYNAGPKCYADMAFLLEQIEQAERRGEERGWKAARRATNGCVISMDYSEGGGPRFVAISDWRNSEEYKKGGG